MRKSSSSVEFSRSLVANEDCERLVIDLLNPSDEEEKSKDKKKKQRLDLTVSDLKVVHVPVVRDAVDSLYAKQLVIKIFADEFLSLFDAQDSLASGAVALRDSI